MLTRIDIKGEIEWTDKRKEKKRKEKKCRKIIDLALERKKRDEIRSRSFHK